MDAQNIKSNYSAPEPTAICDECGTECPISDMAWSGTRWLCSDCWTKDDHKVTDDGDASVNPQC